MGSQWRQIVFLRDRTIFGRHSHVDAGSAARYSSWPPQARRNDEPDAGEEKR
jgi:hypothetical protein